MPGRPTIALIEIGTNSTKLLIAELDPVHEFCVRHFSRHTTRLGRGLGRGSSIEPASVNENIAVIEKFKKKVRRHRCQHLFAVSTFALRKARNGRAVAHRLEEAVGGSIKILTGSDEARFAYLSARRNLRLVRPITVLIDIGGGSTEFVVAERRRVTHARSLDLGALHLTERYLHADPIRLDEFAALEDHVDHIVRRAIRSARIDRRSSREIDLAASGGTIGATSLVITHSRRGTPFDAFTTTIRLGEVSAFLDRCLAVPLHSRKRIPGLDPDRADIICGGLAIVLSLMRLLGKRILQPNAGGMREGALMHLIQNGFRW